MPSIIDTLEQGEMWYGQDGYPYRIAEMELSHVANVLAFLRRRAPDLLSRRVHWEAGHAMREGRWSAWVEESRTRLEDDPAAWLERRPLIVALEHELRNRGAVDGEVVPTRGELT